MQERGESAHNPAVTTRAVAWSLLGVSAAFAIVGSWLNVIGHPTTSGLDYDIAFSASFLGFSAIGAVVAARVPANPIGWLLIAQGVCWELSGVMAGYANEALFVSDHSWPAGRLAAWSVNWLFIPAIAPVIVLFLLFPDGRLLSQRWRPVLWLTLLAVVLAFADSGFAPGPLHELPALANPLGLTRSAESVFRVVRDAGDLAFTIAAWLAIASLVVRFRRAGGVERLQLKWL